MFGRGLSKYQKNILEEMSKEGVYLYTNEGKDFRCWLQYKDGTKKTVRKDTTGLLFELGYITNKYDVSNVYYVYERTNKKVY